MNCEMKTSYDEVFQKIWKFYIKRDEEEIGNFDTRVDKGIFLRYATNKKRLPMLQQEIE